MLNEKRVLHIARMEMRRQKEQAEIAPFINVDKRDYLSFKRVTGFVIGSLFYAIAVCVLLVLLFAVLLSDINRVVLVLTVVLSIVGYVAFLYFYQSWNHRHNLERIRRAKKKIRRLRKDWDKLEDLYQQEEEEASPTVDLEALIPEGSLGENE